MVGVYFMPESPKYLVSKKKYDEARLAINTIARVNNTNKVFDCQFDSEVNELRRRSTIDILNANSGFDSQTKAALIEEKKLDGSLKDLFKIRRLSINLLLMIFFWVASSFSYFLVNYTIKKIPGDFFINNLVSALAAIPTTAIGGTLYARLGVKKVFFLFFLIATFGGIALVILSESQPDLVPIMVAFAKGGV